jgi:hypothetical protein
MLGPRLVGSILQERDDWHECVKCGRVEQCDLAPAELRRGLDPGVPDAVFEQEADDGSRRVERRGGLSSTVAPKRNEIPLSRRKK